MGLIIDILKKQSAAGDTAATALLNDCAATREKELVSAETKKVNQQTARMLNILRKTEEKVKGFARGRLSKDWVARITEDAVNQGWTDQKLRKEVEKATRMYEKELIAQSLKERDKALGKIQELRPRGDGGRFQRIEQPSANVVGWTEDEIISYLCDPSKLTFVASKLGWSKERCGKVSAYLRWRLNSDYQFGIRALSPDEMKAVRKAAKEVLALRK